MGNFLTSFGEAYSIYGAIVGTIVSIIMIIIGALLLRRKDLYTKHVQGRVMSASCTPSGQQFSCSMHVHYIVGGKHYSGVVSTTNSTPYSSGQTIELAYVPSDPSKVEVYSSITPHMIGWGLLAVGILILVASWLNVWLAKRYKGYAGVEGVGGIAQFFQSF